ncbi:MAG: hypothetical protein ACRBBW_11895 [Cellvibrionaceae bacterium]
MKRLIQVFAAVLALGASSFGWAAVGGGDCESQPRVDLAQLTTLFGDVQLTLASGETYDLSPEQLPENVKRDDYFKVSSVYHISGGCVPFLITNIEPIEKEGFYLNPESEHAYPALFRLSEVRACSRSDNEICKPYASMLESLTDQQRQALEAVSVKTLGSCSASTMEQLLPQLEKPEQGLAVIACAQMAKDDSQELAMQLTVSQKGPSATDDEPVRPQQRVAVTALYKSGKGNGLYFSIPGRN